MFRCLTSAGGFVHLGRETVSTCHGAQYTAGDNDCHVKTEPMAGLADAQLGKTTSSGRARVGMNGVGKRSRCLACKVSRYQPALESLFLSVYSFIVVV